MGTPVELIILGEQCITRAGASDLPIRNLISMRTYVCIVIRDRVSNARVYGVASIVGILLSLVACGIGPDGLCFFSGLLFYSFILRSFTYYSLHPAHYSFIILTTIYSTYYINVRKLYNTEQYNLLDCNKHNCK